MLTSSHAYVTWRLVRGPATPWAVAGAMAPDAPAIVAGVTLAARGHRGSDLLRRVYQRGALARVNTLFHSALTPATLLSGRPGHKRLGFAIGWAGHVAVDYLTHHSDAWPPLFPLSAKRFAAPVSYWEIRHHARLVSLVETAALAGLAATDRKPWRRRAGFVAALLAAFPAVRPHVFRSHAGATAPARRASPHDEAA